MTTGIFTVLVIVAMMVASACLNPLAGMEKRATGAVTLAPKLLLGLLAGALGLFYLDDAMAPARSEEMVRRLFHLPEDVEVGRVHGGVKEPVCYASSVYRRTTIQFTPAQFARYVASINDPNLWRPEQPLHYSAHKSRLQFTQDALAWQELPEPKRMGKQQLVWKIASEDVRTGLAQCYDINRVDERARVSVEDGPAAYTVTRCDAIMRSKTPVAGGRVTAALDFDRQRLNVAVHFNSKPDYCNNRITKWLAAALGLAVQ